MTCRTRVHRVINGMAGFTAGIVRASAATANNSDSRSQLAARGLPWKVSWRVAALASL
jgi:hypothetical protein